MVGYQTSSEGQKELFDWLRENPHRLHLGQIGLRLTGAGPGEIGASDISDAEQQLDLWAGAITSRFTLRGKPVTVRTAVHPALDLLAVSVESELIREKLLAVRFAFPYGSPKMQAADWEKPGSHQSGLVNGTSDRADIRRTLDADEYHAAVSWAGGAKFSPEQSHTFLLNPSGTGARLEFVAAFSPRPSGASLPGVAATFAAARRHWERFWMTGGAVELAGSRDPRAAELERRVVLSQYLTAIQCAGSLPPQQPGLTSVFLAHSRRPRE